MFTCIYIWITWCQALHKTKERILVFNVQSHFFFCVCVFFISSKCFFPIVFLPFFLNGRKLFYNHLKKKKNRGSFICLHSICVPFISCCCCICCPLSIHCIFISFYSCLPMYSLCSFNYLYVSLVKLYSFLYPYVNHNKKGDKI